MAWLPYRPAHTGPPCEHCFCFWPNIFKCDPPVALSGNTLGLTFQQIRSEAKSLHVSAILCTRLCASIQSVCHDLQQLPSMCGPVSCDTVGQCLPSSTWRPCRDARSLDQPSRASQAPAQAITPQLMPSAQHSAAQHRPAQASTGQHSTWQHSTRQHLAAHLCPAHGSTAHASTWQRISAQHMAARVSSAHLSSARHSTAQHSPAHVRTCLHSSAGLMLARRLAPPVCMPVCLRPLACMPGHHTPAPSACRVSTEQLYAASQQLHNRCQEALRRQGGGSYNVLLTLSMMMYIPRRQGSAGPCSLK